METKFRTPSHELDSVLSSVHAVAWREPQSAPREPQSRAGVLRESGTCASSLTWAARRLWRRSTSPARPAAAARAPRHHGVQTPESHDPAHCELQPSLAGARAHLPRRAGSVPARARGARLAVVNVLVRGGMCWGVRQPVPEVAPALPRAPRAAITRSPAAGETRERMREGGVRRTTVTVAGRLGCAEGGHADGSVPANPRAAGLLGVSDAAHRGSPRTSSRILRSWAFFAESLRRLGLSDAPGGICMAEEGF